MRMRMQFVFVAKHAPAPHFSVCLLLPFASSLAVLWLQWQPEARCLTLGVCRRLPTQGSSTPSSLTRPASARLPQPSSLVSSQCRRCSVSLCLRVCVRKQPGSRCRAEVRGTDKSQPDDCLRLGNCCRRDEERTAYPQTLAPRMGAAALAADHPLHAPREPL